ncbi:NAD(P)H-dependent oxidoreductase [Zhouia amylolytica]|uniref:NAD(P)H-dependent oxidoreductase n=1 Tax=Zhouia amylolytica TaxID=376730 RepID=UPI0020CF781A|nr:NAD(P)H-dependent oxidoreductase [Zhouia amylolytica]MCQ0112249.1 NAD(P)H-dependent oxidoreductase [Zhouia amylolytica]
MEKQQTVLLINTHLTYPNWSEGGLNKAFQDKAKAFFEESGYEVLETMVENGYEPAEEVEKHLQADIVILQTPVNWFGAPWIYKKYVDEVFNAGLFSKKFQEADGRSADDPSKQYGTGGKMYGKKFMVSATWNAPKAAFGNPDQVLMQGKTTADLFLNLTSSYRFVGYDIMPDYGTFDIFREGNIVEDLENYPKYLSRVFEVIPEIL